MRIFIAGPGSAGKPAFDVAAAQLETAGYAKVTGFYIFGGSDEPPYSHSDDPEWRLWPHFALPDLAACDGLALLDGWRRSCGTCMEVGFAAGRGITVANLKWWLKRSPDQAATE